MKRLINLLLLILFQCQPITAQEKTTNYDVAVAIVELSKDLNGEIPSANLKNLIDDIVYALDRKDEAIDYNASIASQWQKVAEEKKQIWWGFSTSVKLNDLFPTIGFIILF